MNNNFLTVNTYDWIIMSLRHTPHNWLWKMCNFWESAKTT